MKKAIWIAAAAVIGGYAIGGATAQWVPPSKIPFFGNATTGSGTQTFTNSPCTGTTSEQWIPVQIYGTAGGNYYIPACQ